MEIDFSVDDAQLAALFTNFERPTSGLMKAIAEYLYSRTSDSFKTQTSPSGSQWAALNPKYAVRKANDKKTRRSGILQQSGQLLDAIASEATEDTAVLKTNRPVGSYDLGAIHALGAPRRNIPARPFFPINDQGELLAEDIEEIQGLIADYFAL